MRILISLLSDYLQPNMLLIKEFDGAYDKLIFITTGTMEKKKKSYWLEMALQLPKDSVDRIEVVEDDYEKIIDRLVIENFSQDDEYILNLTGGTKVMPLAVYEFFKPYNAKYYYVPQGKNVIKDISASSETVLNYRLNLKEYFTLSGITFTSEDSLTFPSSHTFDLFNSFRKVSFVRKRLDVICNAHKQKTASERSYYSGKWFEEYCYLRLKREHNLSDEYISKGVKIYREDKEKNDNEVDVMFLKDNQLYMFECKVTTNGYVVNGVSSAKEAIEHFQYKLAAISKDYGLRVKSYILTLHSIFHNRMDFPELTIENIYRRNHILGLMRILDSEDFIKDRLDLTEMIMPEKKRKETVENNHNPKLKILGKIDLSKVYDKKRKS